MGLTNGGENRQKGYHAVETMVVVYVLLTAVFVGVTTEVPERRVDAH